LEYPHYTRPRQFEGEEIPEVLLSGDHAAIAAWRRGQAEAITKARRPDLFTRYQDRKKAEPDSAERQGIDHERD
jgi:tRNA (guanine37-N1)-methyltransferase